MNLVWTSGDFVGPKHHRPDLAGYPIIGRWVPMAHGFGGSHELVRIPATAPGSRTGSEVATRRDRSRRRRGGGGDPAGVGERSGGPPHAGPVVLDDDGLGVNDPGQHQR
jgi:hypothetical protein